ncbi:hypothetical protein GCM10010106_13100 [Thermopolyspora flexuosa]|nr:hypothetical protein GCM10010106_13100 [Thermopolyspora flexuosa]
MPLFATPVDGDLRAVFDLSLLQAFLNHLSDLLGLGRNTGTHSHDAGLQVALRGYHSALMIDTEGYGLACCGS